MATSREMYQYERGRYDQYQDSRLQRISCAPSPAARQQINDEGDQLRARLGALADDVRNAGPRRLIVRRNAPATLKPSTATAAEGDAGARWRAATDYVRRAIATVTPHWWNVIERTAAAEKTAPYQHELDRIDARWFAATDDNARAAIARDAELLADHTQETMPGAPQDRRRTNLWAGETPKHAPATSYAAELADVQSPAVVAGSDEHGAMSKYVVGAVVGVGAIVALRTLLR